MCALVVACRNMPGGARSYRTDLYFVSPLSFAMRQMEAVLLHEDTIQRSAPNFKTVLVFARGILKECGLRPSHHRHFVSI